MAENSGESVGFDEFAELILITTKAVGDHTGTWLRVSDDTWEWECDSGCHACGAEDIEGDVHG